MWIDQIMGRSDPNRFLFLIGAMKSGTSTLSNMLNQHPKIFKGRHKEPNMFASQGSFYQNEEEYLASFPAKQMKKAKEAWHLDASGNYSKAPVFGNAALQIADFMNRRHYGRPKFIYLVRDPIKRIESQISHNVSQKSVVYDDWCKHSDDIDFYKYYLTISSYAEQLALYTDVFPQEDILVIQFENFVENSSKTLESIWQMLGVEVPKEPILMTKRNVRRTEQPYVKDIKLSNKVIALLKAQLTDDMAKLQSDWNVDITRWGFS